MYTYFISARFEHILRSGESSPSVYTNGPVRIEQSQGSLGIIQHSSWISIPWTFVNIMKMSFYKLIKQTFKKTFLAD